MERDLRSSLGVDVALDSQAIITDTTTVGNIIDSQGFESLTFTVLSGVLTDGSYTLLLEDGEDPALSDAATVDSEFIIGTLPVFADTEDNVVKLVGYVGKKRYVRASIVSATTTSGGILSATAVKGNASSRPTS